MDFARAFTFVFEDKDWLKKVGIAGLVMLIPIIGQIVVLGWTLGITQRVINDDPEPLPDWTDFGTHAMHGVQAFVIALVYALPIILLASCNGITTTLLSSGSNSDAGQVLATGAAILAVCFGCLTAIFGIALGLVLPAALGRFAATKQLSAAFQFGEVFGLLRSSIGPYLLVLVGAIASSIVGGLGVIACVIGVIFTYAYAMAVNGHFYGQAYKVATANANPGDLNMPSTM